jgi:hypothetical protein
MIFFPHQIHSHCRNESLNWLHSDLREKNTSRVKEVTKINLYRCPFDLQVYWYFCHDTYLQNDVGFFPMKFHTYVHDQYLSIFNSTKRNSCNRVPIILNERLNFNVWSLLSSSSWRTGFFFFICVYYILKVIAVQPQRYLPSTDDVKQF